MELALVPPRHEEDQSSVAATKWEYIETVHQLSIDFKTAYDSVRREVL
jgi:hypothetical protein